MTLQLISKGSYRSLSNLLPLLLGTLMVPLIFGLSRPVQAQSQPARPAEDASPSAEVIEVPPRADLDISSVAWRSNFDEQAARVLRQEEDAAIQNTMLRNVIAVATQSPADVDLSATVNALVQVCKNDPSEQRRLMAIQALLAIGPEHTSNRLYHRAMNRLYRVMQDEPSQQIRQVAATLLNTYYATGEKTG